MNGFEIAGRAVGPGARPLIIAEVAQAHDGSLGAAHAFIDVAADCGADAIKFQTHIAAAESTLDEPFRVKFSRQDDTRYAYWRRMEFAPEHWAGLAEHARERGLIFLSSAFSHEAVALLEALDMPAWKVASGEVYNLPLIDRMLQTGRPMLLSSGMSGFQDIEGLVAHIRATAPDAGVGIFQCTTEYPTPLENVGLNVLGELRQRFDVPVGLSDHSADVMPGLAAMTLGAQMVEVHLCLHRRMFGPDTVASLDPAQLTELCRGRDAIHTMLTHPVDKAAQAKKLEGTARLFTRSLALKADQPAGTTLSADMLTGKKPGGGIPIDKTGDYIGRRLARDVPANRLLTPADIADF